MTKDFELDNLQTKLQDRFPFLSFGRYVDREYAGIIQNCDNTIVSMYVYNNIQDVEMKKLFLRLGDNWWNESNRTIPINIFLKETFRVFQPYLKTFARKEWEHLAGPMTSLSEIMTKRIKRRQISLVSKRAR